jgi:catechol 2,3-dioxygenase-like lactoylglutathione lyase family enzyme
MSYYLGMAPPIIKVRDVAFPRFQAPDLDLMQSFLEAFGMHVSHKSEDALYMRGTSSTHHIHVTHKGDTNFLGLAFFASRQDLDTLSDATGVPVGVNNEPGGGYVVHLTDPDGRMVDVVADIAEVPPIATKEHAPVNTADARVRVDILQRVPLGPCQVKRFGHSAIKTTSLKTTAAWYHDTLGLLASDDTYLEDPEAPFGRFMRCDRGDEGADHHSLLVLETGEVKLGHCAWEVADFDDLMAGREALTAFGARHYWGVGRHILGGQVFDYWKDPFNFTVEHWTDTDLLTASVAPASHSVFEGINQWGPNPPDDLDF